MNNWKVISQIAALSGTLFIIFAALAGFINYLETTIYYSSFVPASFIQVRTISAMLPFILIAILSFAVAVIGSRAAKETPENEHTYTHPSAAGTTV